MKTQRKALIEKFKELGKKKNFEKKEKILLQLDSTYPSPASEVPRLELWSIHKLMVEAVGNAHDFPRCIKHVLWSLRTSGFIIEGGDISVPEGALKV